MFQYITIVIVIYNCDIILNEIIAIFYLRISKRTIENELNQI